MGSIETTSVGQHFPAQMKISERRLTGFCTNEVGTLLNEFNAAIAPKSAIIGNPLRYASFDELSAKRSHTYTGTATSMKQNCNGKYLSIASGTVLSIFDVQKGAILREFHEHAGIIGGIAWHRTSPWLLASVAEDSTLRLWDLRMHPAQLQMRRTARPFTCLEYSPDCNFIACGGHIISIYDLNMTQSISNMQCNSPVNRVHFNPAECLLATTNEDCTICFWDVDTGECVTQSPPIDPPVGQICFAEDGQYLIANNGHNICSIRWEPFELFSQLTLHTKGRFPSKSASLQVPADADASASLTHLDMCTQNGVLYNLSMFNDTACLSTIRLSQLETFSPSAPTTDFAGYLPELGSSNNNSISSNILFSCPTRKSCNNLLGKSNSETPPIATDEEDQRLQIREQLAVEDVSPESIATTGTTESDSLNLKSDKLGSAGALPLKKNPQKKLQTLVSTSGVSTISSVDSGRSGSGSGDFRPQRQSSSARSSNYDLRSPSMTKEFTTPKIPESGAGGSLAGKRPNRLPLNNQQQQTQKHSNSFSCQSGRNASYTKKQLFRRGSSLTDVTDPVTPNTKNNASNNNNNTPTNSSNNMHCSVPQCRTRSRSRATSGRDRVQTFSTSSSSNASSSTYAVNNPVLNVTMIDGGGGSGDAGITRRNTRRLTTKHSESDSEDELAEFMQQSKVYAGVKKHCKDVCDIVERVNVMRGDNISECLVNETSCFAEPHAYACLLEQYLSLGNYTMPLNEAFLSRVDLLMQHRNNKYVRLALEFLRMVTTQFGQVIRHGLAVPEFSIGVDVAADQRFERCEKCRKALLQIRLNAFNTKRLNPAQLHIFESEIVPRIDQIGSASSAVASSTTTNNNNK